MIGDARFQFHKGTIRTVSGSRATLMVVHFNSIKVRLERASYRQLLSMTKISIP